MKVYLVGGTIRDLLMDLPITNDFDFAVEALDYEHMRAGLLKRGAKIWKEREDCVSIRCQCDVSQFGSFGGILNEHQIPSQVSADFTLCRAETMYSDRRHPDTVTPTSIINDLDRRDFTVNALAVAADGGDLIGSAVSRRDIDSHTLRCVGDPRARFTEDPLRMVRALRFHVTHDLSITSSVRYALADPVLARGLGSLPVERVYIELRKMLEKGPKSIATLYDFPLMLHVFDELGISYQPVIRKTTEGS
jgi:tRNA nucleotidyltransferase/poly(A) polymerase